MKQQCESQNSNPAKKSANQDARSSSHQQQQLANQKDGPPGGQSDMRDNNRGASNILGANSSTGQKRDLDETDQRQDNKTMRTDDERYNLNVFNFLKYIFQERQNHYPR